MFILKNDKYHKLETGWNDRVIEHRESKYIKASAQSELAQLMRKSAPASVKSSGDAVTGNDSVFSAKPTTAVGKTRPPSGGGGEPQTSVTSTMYESITKAVGFKHHRGTDRNAELKVLKAILQRENKLIELQTECNKIAKEVPSLRTHDRTGILDLLSQIRDLTVVTLENITTWRETMVNADPEAPRPFMWQKHNYVLKMVDDLNFLSYVDPLVSAMKINPDKMIKNPLMLPDTLEGMNVDDEAFGRAQEDAHGNSKGPVFLERLRLRIAEQVFVKEIEFNKFGMPSIAWTEYNPSVASNEPSLVSTEDGSLRIDKPADLDEANEERKISLLTWQQQANSQLRRILSCQGEHLRSASTHRMSIPSPTRDDEEFKGQPKFSYYPTPVVVPSLLTELQLGTPVEQEAPASPIYLRGHFRSSPRMEVLVTEEKREKSATKSAKPKSGKTKNRPPQTLSPGVDSSDDSFGSFADDNGLRRKGKGVREIKGLPEKKAFVDPIPSDIFAPLLTLESPPITVLRATGAVRILTADPNEIPDDLTWPKFLELAKTKDIAQSMIELDVNTVPKFKIRAVTPFLEQLSALMDMDNASEHIRKSVERIISWIQQVVDTANGDAPRTIQQPSSSPTGSAFGDPGKKALKPVRQRKTTRDTSGGGSTELRLLAYRPPTPHDSNLAVVYSEMISTLFVRPVVLSLLVPSFEKGNKQYLPTTANNDNEVFKKGLDKPLSKYIVAKVYDAATSHTSETVLNLREYVKYQSELVQAYHDDGVLQLYQPERTGWWIENLKHVSTVTVKPGGDLALRVSKSMIGRRVARYLGVYMSQDSADRDDASAKLNDNSTQSGSGGDLYGAQPVATRGKKQPIEKKTQIIPTTREVKESPPKTVKTAPTTKKKRQPPAVPVRAATTKESSKPLPAKSQQKNEIEATNPSADSAPLTAQYGSRFVPVATKDASSSVFVKPSPKEELVRQNRPSKVIDPYKEPSGGFKSVESNDIKPNIVKKSIKKEESIPAGKLAETINVQPPKSNSVQVVEVKSAPVGLSDTVQTTFYDDEFEDAEEESTVPKSSTLTTAPKRDLEPARCPPKVEGSMKPEREESAGYDDDFDDAGYDEEFEDAERKTVENNIEKKMVETVLPQEEENKKPVSGKDWDIMKKQLTQELESPSETVAPNNYDDDFDLIVQDSTLNAPDVLILSDPDEVKIRNKNELQQSQKTFELEVVDDKNDGEGSINSLKDAIVNAAASIADGTDEYADDDFDD